jgi:hypothetical protein
MELNAKQASKLSGGINQNSDVDFITLRYGKSDVRVMQYS